MPARCRCGSRTWRATDPLFPAALPSGPSRPGRPPLYAFPGAPHETHQCPAPPAGRACPGRRRWRRPGRYHPRLPDRHRPDQGAPGRRYLRESHRREARLAPLQQRPEVVAAIASGDVQLGNLGSSPLAAATSRGLPIVAFIVSAQINAAEALVVRNGSKIEKPEDLVGKTIATPFVSTSHYSLLGALKHWNIDPGKVKIVNLNPTEIAAAWRRGDIDGAFVWSPALGEIKKSGKVLTDAAEVGQWGAPTFEVWVARKDFAEKHPEVIAKFAKVSLDSFADYNAHKAEWTADSEQVKKIAKLTGADPKDVPELLAGSAFPESQAQLSSALLGGGTAKDIAGTAAFLKEQKRVPSVLKDYSPYVSAEYVRQAESVQVGQR
ncbi:taurine ABC transporter substrate-binding protein [Pseudomonas nitroreducens]|uniref:taurine ABC transporter substrate-binding protein n=1 Tax=Pseudomonas nitroreducens TaxID=46680 RepID=UPI0030B8A5DF